MNGKRKGPSRSGGFTYPRRVAFGECDPARIYYTPRAIDYCVEAIEAWWESTLSATWSGMLARRGLEVRFLHAGSEFLRPLTVGQVVRVGVRVPEAGRTRLSFRVTGQEGSGEPNFRALLEVGLFDRRRRAMVPIPGEVRERIARYEAACGHGEELPERERGRRPPRGPRRFPKGLFARTVRVVFGDCSPSGTVYPPKIFGYAVEAVGEWFEEVPGISWLALVSVRKQGAPAVAASCDFHRPMTAGQAVAVGVRVTRLGRASIGLSVEGNDPDGLPLFDSRITLCYIDQEGGFRSMPIPEEFRRRIREYRAACGDGGV